MNRAWRIVVAMMVCSCLGTFAQAQQVTLKVGDAAPALVGGKWLKGEPVGKLETGKIYVMEFWATWCPPCRDAIPHVTELQKRYGKDGVVVVGQDVWENNQESVEPFVTEMGEKMDYRVRMDDVSDGSRGKMAESWLVAAGQSGIPCTFIVGKDGKIAWIGHPMAMEPVLKQVIAGTFDVKKAAAAREAQEKIGQALMAIQDSGDLNKALSALDDLEKSNPGLAGQISVPRFQILWQKQDYPAAYKAAAKIGQSFNENPMVLNDVAWTIADAPEVPNRDLDVAEKLAKQAVDLTQRKDGAVLDTLARVHFEKGQIDKAIAVQTEAVAVSNEDELKQTLEKYKAAKK